MIVVDAAVLANAVGDDGEAGSQTRHIRRSDEHATVPDALDRVERRPTVSARLTQPIADLGGERS